MAEHFTHSREASVLMFSEIQHSNGSGLVGLILLRSRDFALQRCSWLGDALYPHRMENLFHYLEIPGETPSTPQTSPVELVGVPVVSDKSSRLKL